jgi:hypothetical protein
VWIFIRQTANISDSDRGWRKWWDTSVKEEQRNSDITLMWKLSMRRHWKLKKQNALRRSSVG